MALRTLTLDELTIDDERSFRHVGLYEELKAVLRSYGAEHPGVGGVQLSMVA